MPNGKIEICSIVHNTTPLTNIANRLIWLDLKDFKTRLLGFCVWVLLILDFYKFNPLRIYSTVS